MKYTWKDYTSEQMQTVESWLDTEALKYTGCDEGFDAFYEYWKNSDETTLGADFWCKVISDDAKPFGVIALSLYNGVLTVMEYIIAPVMRGKGYGTTALREFLVNSEQIIGNRIDTAKAVIFPTNIASQKAFEKAGFIFDHAHQDGDALYYRYTRLLSCFCGHDCSRCLTYLATVNNDDNLRRKSQQFYKDIFSLDIPIEKFHCLGGRSNDVFYLCKDCPWMKCAKEKGLSACSECADYPCKPLAEYQEKYVNKYN